MLILAVSFRLEDIIPKLLEMKLDIKKKDSSGRSAIFYACRRSNECWDLLSKIRSGPCGLWYTDSDCSRLSPFTLGAGADKVDPWPIAQQLVRRGADPNDQDNSGRTPLSYVSSGWLAQSLIRFASDVDVYDLERRTPLFHACGASYNSSLGIIPLLLSNGSNPSTVDVHGKTPLYYFVKTFFIDQREMRYSPPAFDILATWPSSG